MLCLLPRPLRLLPTYFCLPSSSTSFSPKPLQIMTAKCLKLWEDWLVIRWFVFHPDVNKMVDWALKTYLPTCGLFCPEILGDLPCWQLAHTAWFLIAFVVKYFSSPTRLACGVVAVHHCHFIFTWSLNWYIAALRNVFLWLTCNCIYLTYQVNKLLVLFICHV